MLLDVVDALRQILSARTFHPVVGGLDIESDRGYWNYTVVRGELSGRYDRTGIDRLSAWPPEGTAYAVDGKVQPQE